AAACRAAGDDRWADVVSDLGGGVKAVPNKLHVACSAQFLSTRVPMELSTMLLHLWDCFMFVRKLLIGCQRGIFNRLLNQWEGVKNMAKFLFCETIQVRDDTV